MYVPRLLHAMNDVADSRTEFCDWFLHKCDEREFFLFSVFGLMKPLLNLMVPSIDTTVCTGPLTIHA
jgi:hypothetical protein